MYDWGAVLEEDLVYTVRPSFENPLHMIIQQSSDDGNVKIATCFHKDRSIIISDAFGRFSDSIDGESTLAKLDTSSTDGTKIKSQVCDNIKIQVNMVSSTGPELLLESPQDVEPRFPIKVRKSSFLSRNVFAKPCTDDQASDNVMFQISGGRSGNLRIKKGTPMKLIPAIFASWRLYLRCLRIFVMSLFIIDAILIASLLYATYLTGNQLFFGVLVAVHFVYVCVAFLLLV